MRFAFIAKHRGIWPVSWLCGALGVSRSGFHAWLSRAPSARMRSDETLGAKVRASFISSYRTYGARRVWHDLLAEDLLCGLHSAAHLRLRSRHAHPNNDVVDQRVNALRGMLRSNGSGHPHHIDD